MIEVHDTGRGIPADEQAHVYERIFRVELPEGEALAPTTEGMRRVKMMCVSDSFSVTLVTIKGI